MVVYVLLSRYYLHISLSYVSIFLLNETAFENQQDIHVTCDHQYRLQILYFLDPNEDE